MHLHYTNDLNINTSAALTSYLRIKGIDRISQKKTQNMTNWKVSLRIKQDFIPLIEEIIYGLEEEHFPTISDFEITGETHLRQLEIYYPTPPDLTLLQQRISVILPSIDLSLEKLEDKDWVTESQKLLRPVDAGRFFIYGRHDADKIPPGRISLCLEAGQAFGTGQHETTHGCLLAINDLVQEFGNTVPKTALDLGCGSGLLALAMAKVWPATIIASDIDPIAAETTLQNATANNIDIVETHSRQSGIAVIISDGFKDTALGRAGPYEVIIANILAGPLQDMAPDIVANLERTGSLVLSGLLNTQEQTVLKAYEKQGLSLVKRYGRGEWVSLLLRAKNYKKTP